MQIPESEINNSTLLLQIKPENKYYKIINFTWSCIDYKEAEMKI